MLHTRKSQLALCTANMSDFCFDEDACHAKPTIGAGATELERVWRMVKVGSSEAMMTDPFL